MRTYLLCVTLVALAFSTACQDSATSAERVCPSDLQARMDRSIVTIRRADSTRLQATALGCGGTVPLETSWAWAATDTNVLRVDVSSGWVYGVRAGVSEVVATSGPRYSISVRSVVTVVP